MSPFPIGSGAYDHDQDMANLATLQSAFSNGRNWQLRGHNRYRCQIPNQRLWCYFLIDPKTKRVAQLAISEVLLLQAAEMEDLERWIDERLDRDLTHQLLPPCVAPGCDRKGSYHFTAAEDGRLAGRAWQRGDQIDLCPPHAMDIYRAQGAYGLDQLADWLRPDARLNPLDAYDACSDSLYGSEIRRNRARALHLRPAQP